MVYNNNTKTRINLYFKLMKISTHDKENDNSLKSMKNPVEFLKRDRLIKQTSI